MNDLVETKTSIFRNTNQNGYIFENNDDKQIAKYCKNINNKIQFGFKNRKLDFLVNTILIPALKLLYKWQKNI